MKIPAPNYTHTPNVCFDEIFKTLTEGELRVILVIIRQTFGWHKNYDRISLNQLAEKSGMERKSVCRSLNSLIKKNLICKRKIGDPGKEKCYYNLVMEQVNQEEDLDNDGIETQEDEELISNNLYQCPKDTTPVSVGHPPSVRKTPTKETLTKETIQKKQQQNNDSCQPSIPPEKSENVAAAFSEKTQQQQQPKIYECLLQFDFPEEEKVLLSSKYSEAVVAAAVAWATHPETRINKGFLPAIKWACQNKPKLPQSKADMEQENKNFAMRFDGLKSDIFNVAVLNRYIEIIFPTANCQSWTLRYNEHGFREQLTNTLRKLGVRL